MDALATELEAILNCELILHEKLLESAKKMNLAIKEEKLDMVTGAQRQYDDLICKIEKQEEKRLAASDRIAKHFKMEQRVNLEKTLSLFPEQYRKPLEDVRSRLKSTLSALNKVNTVNRIMLEETLKTIAKSFEIISIASQKLNGYKRLGKKDYVKTSRPIFNTVV
jgi:hypothetical protein